MTKYVVANSSDVPPGERITVDIEGRSIGIFNLDGEYFGLLNQCPHAGAPLCSAGHRFGLASSSGPTEPITYERRGELLRCPWHLWEFDIRTGQSQFDPRNLRVRTYDVEAVPGAPEDVVNLEADRQVGPFILEGYEVSVDDADMLVVDTSRRRRGITSSDLMSGVATGTMSIDSVVRELRREAEGVVSLVLERADGAAFEEWAPGAHVDLVLAPELERQYSLCGDPLDRNSMTVAVLREPRGRGGSEWVHTRLAVGDRLSMRGPRNKFALEDAEAYLFIAGGIGITPILSMIQAVDARGLPWRLVYGGRRRESMAFAKRLTQTYGDRVQLWPEQTKGLIDLAGLLSQPLGGTAVYCCGPEPLLKAVEAHMSAWPKGALHIERFRPREGAFDGPREAFDVELHRSGIAVNVSAGSTILEAVGAAGIHVPSSCREGTCGTCETIVLKGTPDHRDSYLNEREQASNEVMMICCSRSKSPRLVLDL